MALIALVGASEMLPDGGLRALAQIAGETLIERQAARLAEVGVTHMAVAVVAVRGDFLATCHRIHTRSTQVKPLTAPGDPPPPVDGDVPLMSAAPGQTTTRT